MLQVLKAADQRVVCPSHTPWLSPWSLSDTVFISSECTRQQMSMQSTESARPHQKATSSPKQALKSGHVCACCPSLALWLSIFDEIFPCTCTRAMLLACTLLVDYGLWVSASSPRRSGEALGLGVASRGVLPQSRHSLSVTSKHWEKNFL